ncbi:MAG TPA: hypothetical protein VMR37_05750 [Rhabdochlamydiaceae bacterium]|nr:hypothetical protein [Rhabdochlamydiaceae bacterium]
MKPLSKLLLLLPLSLFSLEIEPWFCNVWEFTFTPSYNYGRFNSVQNGHPQLKKPFNENLLTFDLEVSPSPNWDLDGDVEFAATTAQSMGFRSGALQARYLWLDDVIGDAVSLTTGLSARGVSSRSLRDISCPYHAHANFEANTSIGKEWDQGFDWRLRLYGFGALGMANIGYPWARAFLMFEGNVRSTHRFGIFAEGYFGFGNQERVNTHHFDGYADIRHQNIDAGLKYTYVFEIWGQLSFAYTRRLYAHSFPENVNFFTISYMLPFSLF